MRGYQQELDSLKGQKEQVGELGLPTDQIDDAIKELEDTIEKLEKEIEPTTIEKAGLKVTDSDLSDITPTPADATNVVDEVALTGGGGGQDTGPVSTAGQAGPPSQRGGGADMGSVSTAGQAGPPSQRGGGADMGSVSTAGQAGPPSQRGGGGGGGSGGCFLKGTQVTMADGSTKAIEQVDLGDKVAKGGKVFATGKFLVENLHDYKGVKVSGSHMVSEDGNWVRVEDSKHGKPLGDDEHTVYVFGSENRRILINGITFTDYFELNEQDKLLNNEKDFFNNWKNYASKDSQNNVEIINAI